MGPPVLKMPQHGTARSARTAQPSYGPIEAPEHVRYGGLHAEGHSREAACSQLGQRALVNGVGVGLGGDLGIRCEPEQLVHC